jgi:hypothetical protein
MIIKLLRSLDDKLGEVINGQARLEALLDQSALEPEGVRPVHLQAA